MPLLTISHNTVTSPTVTYLFSHFNDHFPGEPGLAGVYWSKGWWRGGATGLLEL